MTIHTARPRLPVDNAALLRDCDADAATGIPGLMRGPTPPTEDQVAAAFAQSIRELAREFATDASDSNDAAARLALRVAARLADPGDRPLLDLLIRAEAPRTRCAHGSVSAAEDVRDLAEQMQKAVEQIADEAEAVLASA